MAEVVPVTFVSSHAQLGGAERYLETLFENLGPGWVAGVVCLQDGPIVARLRDREVPTVVLETGAGPLAITRSAVRLRRLLRRERPAVVHANGVKAALVSALATPGTGIPVVWVKHDFSWDGTLARLVARGCKAVVGVSQAVVETFEPSDKIFVVHNGLPATKPDREAGRRRLEEVLGVDGAAKVVALVGRIDPVKGQRELLAVLPDLLQRVPEIRVAFVGAESPTHAGHAAELRTTVASDGLGDAVSFLGFRDDVLELISGCDALAVPTVSDERGFGREGFGFVGLEAFAAGTPVVGYDDGALREVLGECALLVPPGDRAALADALVRVLDDASLRESLTRCGRERVATSFSVEAMVEAMKKRYRAAAET
jgi:glycosyltransferase involved in cell wall biosynthesis